MEKYLLTTVCMDYLLMNGDRHLSNFEFICDDNGNWRPAPLYDFGQAFMKKSGGVTKSQFIVMEQKFKSLPFSRKPEKI